MLEGKEHPIQIALVGDIMIQGRAAERLLKEGVSALAERLRAILEPADVAIGNFETMALPPGMEFRTEWRSPPEAVDTVAEAGFDAVSMATNHTHDHGPAATAFTLERLAQAGVHTFGVGNEQGDLPEPLVLQREGISIGLLGYASMSNAVHRSSYTAVMPKAKRLARDVGALRTRADVVIVSIHHGIGDYPSPQLCGWAEAAMKAGASAVVVHHSHRVSAVVPVETGVAAYGLGNAVAPFAPGTPERWGLVLRLEIRDGRLDRWWYDPLLTDDDGWPRRPKPDEMEIIRRHLDTIHTDLERPDYSGFYWSTIGGQQRGAYLRSWRRELKQFGVRAFVRKLRNLRLEHLRLLLRMLLRR